MVLMVLDTQKGITDERLFAFDKFKKNVITLIETARSAGVEVVYVRHDDGPGSGFSFGDEAFEIYVMNDHVVVTDMMELLKTAGRYV